MSLKTAILIVLMIVVKHTYSQGWQYPYINYTIKDGLPSNEVYDVIQDSLGYLWFATDNGLSRFDGYNFRNYGKEKGLTDRVVFDLQLDKYGRIWMSSLTRKIFIYDARLDSVLSFKQINDLVSKCVTTKLNYFFYNNTDELRVDCRHSNFYFKITANNEIKNIELKNDSTVVSRNGAKIKYLDKNDSIEILVNNKPYFKRTNVTWQEKKVSNYYNYFLLPDSSVYIGYDIACVIFSDANQFLMRRQLRNDDLIFLENGEVIASYASNGGLKRFSDINSFKNNVNVEELLIGESVSGILIDKQGNLWACSNKNGVFKLKLNRDVKYKNLLYKTQRTPARKIINIDENNFYNYFTNGDYFRVNKLDGLESDYFSSKDKISLNDVYIFQDKHYLLKENLHFGFYKNGFFHQLTLHCINRGFLAGKNVLMTIERSEIQFIFASVDGLYVYKPKHNYCYLYPSPRIIDVLKTFENQIILTGVNGLYHFTGDEILPYKRNLDPYLNSRIDFAEQLKDSTLILASKNDGIYFLKDSCLDYYDFIHEFNIDLIKLIEVNNDDIWIITSKSIIVLKYKHQSIINASILRFGIELPLDQVHSLIFDKDYVYVGMEKNITKLSNSEIFLKAKYSPKPIIESFILNNNNLNEKNKYVFKYNENNISIRILAINYNLSGNINYRYAINGDKYKDLQNSRTLNLVRLSEGKYNLKFIAQNESGEWSEPTLLNFTILPPWWRSWWFYLASSLGLMMLSYLFFRRRLIQQKKDSILNEEIRNLEKSALQAQMNPHFIFNSLNSIQKFILSNDKVEASEYLFKFATLIRLNLKASNVKLITLNEEISLLNLYLEMEKLRFKNKFDFIIQTESLGKEIDDIKIPPLLIQPIVENSIIHGIANSKVKGWIEITIEKFEDQLVITVKDNGKGLSLTEKTSSHQSFGSKITKRRLELIGKENQNNFDLYNIISAEGEIVGTEAKLKIKI